MLNPFIHFMSHITELNHENQAILEAKLRPKKYIKGELILLRGNVCDKVIFITKGLSRSYYTDFTGKTFTWYFHFNDNNSKFENFFALDYQSFLTQTPSKLNIEALTDMETITLDYYEAVAMQAMHIDFERQGKLVTEQAYITTHNRALSLLTLSATQRYEQLLSDEPYLLNKFANHYIASYLGVTPQSLSRIRGEI